MRCMIRIRRGQVYVCVCICVYYHNLGTRNSAGILSSYACIAPPDVATGPGGGGNHMDRAAICNNDKNNVFLARNRPGFTLSDDSDRAKQRSN